MPTMTRTKPTDHATRRHRQAKTPESLASPLVDQNRSVGLAIGRHRTWIERTYHRRRRQDALGRLTPIEYETIMTTPATQAA